MKTRSEFLQHFLKESTFTERIKDEFGAFAITTRDRHRMIRELSAEVKPFFVAAQDSQDPLHDVTIDAFEPRLWSLPKKSLYALYKNFQLYLMTSGDARIAARDMLVQHVTFSYSVNGWYRQRLVQFAQSGKIDRTLVANIL